MSNKASNSSATGMIRAKHLAQEYPECNERRVDAEFPRYACCCQSMRNNLGRENISERQFAFLQDTSTWLLPPTDLRR